MAQTIRALEEDPARSLEATGLRFRPICLSDKPCFDRAMRELDDDICDCSFAVQYIWRGKYHTEICYYEGAVLTRIDFKGGHCYGFPAGGDLVRSVEALKAYCAAAGEKLRFGLLSDKMRSLLEAAFQGKFEYVEDRDRAD